MHRREALALLAGAMVMPLAGHATNADRLRIGAAWRGPHERDAHQVGVLEVDWAAAQVRIHHAVQVPSRPHGLMAEPDGSLLAVALRPGRWLMRLDADGRVAARVDVDDEGGRHRFGGHVVASRDGRVLYTTETDTRTGRGRVGVRDARTLRREALWPTRGIEPHQLLVDPRDGHLLVANGGIPRGPDDAKLDLDRMDSSLVRLHAHTGEPLGQWRLDDARLSLRHMAWNSSVGKGLADDPAGDAIEPPALLGLALQAEHDDPERRTAAPALAVWDGQTLVAPTHDTSAGGYAGDIAPAARGGFAISHARLGRAFLWQPQRPAALALFAELRQPYALSHWPSGDRAADGAPGGVLLATARGVARWHPTQPAALLPWPQPMALDNHWVAFA